MQFNKGQNLYFYAIGIKQIFHCVPNMKEYCASYRKYFFFCCHDNAEYYRRIDRKYDTITLMLVFTELGQRSLFFGTQNLTSCSVICCSLERSK